MASAVRDLETEPMTNGVSVVTGRPVRSAAPVAWSSATWPARTIAIEAPG